MFKLNTVVNKFNYQEDMIEPLKKLNPVRWKVFQCLPVEVKYFTYRSRALKSRSKLSAEFGIFYYMKIQVYKVEKLLDSNKI